MKKFLINEFYFCAGILFLLLAKIKSKALRYSPKAFSTAEIERCIEYDIHVADDWLKHLKEYASDYTIQDKHVLELGPGSDLGAGLYLLSKSVKKYTAADVYDLASDVSPDFYRAFFTYLREKEQVHTDLLEEELLKTRHRQNGRLNYECRSDFNLVEAVGGDKVDLIFSNAAFEHFSDFRKTIQDMSRVVASGSLLVVSIDLQTHSRWIRDKDPNNIYRYSDRLYKLFNFQSSPNRVRPWQYREALEQNGWKNIVIQPEMRLDDRRLNYFQDYLNPDFRDAVNQMNYLTVWICAAKQ
ncbi:MAG: class I SAM-dependent methyltransferase [Dysgonamonadaceae bacterium]|jgi:SAM-dependent methyltransferase|nr:class I SAM-dependent methyltransferase [Dysgonamonadaceae bacterium]